MSDLKASVSQSLVEMVQIQEDAIVSRTLSKNSAGNVSLFAFDKGQGLSEHSAPFDALVQVIEGEATVIIGGESHQVPAGSVILMPADIPHSLEAPVAFKMVLTMLKAPR